MPSMATSTCARSRVFIAHTAHGTLDVVDGERLEYQASVVARAKASGVSETQAVGASWPTRINE
jgi:hypothetical protein